MLYRNLKAEMGRNNITNSDIAKCINKDVSTVSAKLNAPNRITLNECIKIKNKFFPNLTIEYLFAIKSA